MSTSKGQQTLTWLGRIVGLAYILLGLTIGLWPHYWDEAGGGEQALFVSFSVIGGALLLFGLRLLERSPWAGAALVSAGALAGALPFYWSLVLPLVALVLVVLSVVRARRLTAAP